MNELARTETGLTLQPKEITLNQVQIAQTMGQLAYDSGIFKAPKAAAASMIMLKGYELGFPMTAAAEFINVIQNTVGLTPRGAMAIMQNHPEIIRSVSVEDLYDPAGKYIGCRCDIVRIRNGQDHKYSKTFTMEDAQKAQLIKADSGWEKYPAQMCQWRALGFAADLACPDLLAGMTALLKQPELMDEPAPVYTERNPEPVPVVVEPEQPQMTLSDLLAKYDAEKILAANGGAMPRTNAECAEIAKKLEGEGK